MTTPRKGNIDPKTIEIGSAIHRPVSVGSWNLGLTPQQEANAHARSMKQMNTYRTNRYIEHIGNRIRYHKPSELSNFEVVECAFFINIYGAKINRNASIAFNYAMYDILKIPGAATRLINIFNTKKGLPVDFSYISSIHDPMFRHLEITENPVKSGGRKTRRMRKHKKKTRSRK